MIQKLFHTDKGWGKILFILIAYFIFWFITYGIWMFNVIPDPSMGSDAELGYVLSPIYFFIIIPLLSFALLFYCRRITGINFGSLLIFNIFFIVLSIYFFIKFIASNFNFGGF